MLSPADEALCARDPALPGLAEILDSSRLLGQLDRSDLRSTYVRYKPGTSCVVGLTSANGDLHAFGAMAYPPDRYAQIRARTEWRSGPHPARYDDRLCTVLVPLVLDRKLKAARALRSVERHRAYLERFGLKNAALSLLRYKPGRRLVLRADCPSGLQALLKAHAPSAFPRAIDGARHAARFAGVPLKNGCQKHGSIVSEWIIGEVLADTLDAEAFRNAGAEIARLHLTAPRPQGPCTPPDVRNDATALATLLPDCAKEAADMAIRLETALSGRGTAPSRCVIHGDFTADQVVLRHGEPVVIDWDRITEGDPAQDVGAFLARLDADVIETTRSAHAAEEFGNAFLDGYAAAAGDLPDGVDLHRSAALLAIAGEGFRRRRPGWCEEARAILSRADALLPSPAPTRREPMRGLHAALDPGGIGPKISALVGASALERPKVELLRHKERRRALIRYDFPGRPPVLGKLRAKGLDRHTPGLHRRLREAGLDGSSPHLVGVPEALGEIETPALWLQAMVPGRCLGALLAPGRTMHEARLAGRALAVMHNTDTPCARSWSVDDELANLERAFAEIDAPSLRQQAQTIFQNVEAALRALPPTETTGIHRDFYQDQVLIDGDAVWLVDLDLHALGDPLLDIGNFLAHLVELGLRVYGQPEAFRAEAAAFVAGYEEVRGGCDYERLAVLEWVSLARHIAISRRIAGRKHTSDAIVVLCCREPSRFRCGMLPPQPRARAG